MVNPITLKKAKIAYNFGLFECNRVKESASSGILTQTACLAGQHFPNEPTQVLEIFEHVCMIIS